MIVDGFEVLGFHGKPGDVGVRVQLLGDVSDDVFHEHGILIGALRHELLVFPLEHGIDIARSGIFHQLDQILDPNEFSKAYLEPDLASLIMSAEVTDLFGAGTKGGNGNMDNEHEIHAAVQRSLDRTLILHEALAA